MKRISFLQAVVLAVLMVSVVSCGIPMGASGDYYEEVPTRGNVYYGDPYYGGGNTVIVERDPFTGRYYQVSPGLYGSGVHARPAYPSSGRRRYDNNRAYNSRNNASRNNNYYRTYPQQQKPQQTPAQRQQVEKRREQAKESILGKKRN